MGIYIGLAVIDPGVISKLNTKHSVTEAEVKEALMWPATVWAAFDDDSEHGPRWIVYASDAFGRELIAHILPAPEWAGEAADTWVVKSARWLE